MFKSKSSRLLMLALAALGLVTIFQFCQQPQSSVVPVPTVKILPGQIEIFPDASIKASSVKLKITDSNDSVVFSTKDKIAFTPNLKFSFQTTTGISYRADFEYFQPGNDQAFVQDGVIFAPETVIVGIDVPMLNGKNIAPEVVSCACVENAPALPVPPGNCPGIRSLAWSGTLTNPDVRLITISMQGLVQPISFMLRTTGPDNTSFYLGSDLASWSCLTNSPNFCLTDGNRLLNFNDATSGMHFSVKAQKEVNGGTITQKIIIQCHSNYVVTVKQGVNCGQPGGN